MNNVGQHWRAWALDLTFHGQMVECWCKCYVDFYNYLVLLIMVNRMDTDRTIRHSLEVLGLAITMKEQQIREISFSSATVHKHDLHNTNGS